MEMIVLLPYAQVFVCLLLALIEANVYLSLRANSIVVSKTDKFVHDICSLIEGPG
jgi:hypothetical protein